MIGDKHIFTFSEVLPRENDERAEEVDEEEEGEAVWSEEEWEEWEQWEENEENEEDEEDDDDNEEEEDEDADDEEEEEEEEEEEDEEELGGGVLTDLCVVCVTRPRNASFIHGDTGHQVCCFECATKLKNERKRCPVCRKKIKLVVKNFF